MDTLSNKETENKGDTEEGSRDGLGTKGYGIGRRLKKLGFVLREEEETRCPYKYRSVYQV